MVSRWGEMLVLFAIFPIAIFTFVHDKDTWLMPLLGVFGLLCLLLLLRDRQFDVRTVFKLNNTWTQFKGALVWFMPVAIAVSIAVYVLLPDTFLNLPLEQRDLWIMTLLIYPIVSVIPQELIFRTFFFHRYHTLFKRPEVLLVVNSVLFALAHVVYNNWVAVGLSLIGGFIFSYRYWKTQSTVLVILEHTLWGSFVFTIGLGAYLLTEPGIS